MKKYFHESKLLKVLNFQFEVPLPYVYVERVVRKIFRDDKDKNKQLYHLSRILILDSYRTYVCLTYRTIVIGISCILLASGLLGFDIPQLSSPTPPPNAMITEEEQSELETKQFEKWIEEIEPDSNVKVAEVYECMEVIREVFVLNQPV